MMEINNQNFLIEAHSEYFDSESTQDFFDLVGLGKDGTKPSQIVECVTTGLFMAIEGASREQELVSKYLLEGRALPKGGITEDVLQETFDLFLNDDGSEIYASNPKDGHLNFCKMLARALANELVCPNYLRGHRSFDSTDSLATTVAAKPRVYPPAVLINFTLAMFEEPHGLIKIDNMWASYDSYYGNKTVEQNECNLKYCLREYLDSHDMEEVKREIMDAKAPHFQHGWVYQAIVLYLDESSHKDEDDDAKGAQYVERCECLTDLIKRLLDEGFFTLDQVSRAIRQVEAENLHLDYPNYRTSMAQLTHAIGV